MTARCSAQAKANVEPAATRKTDEFVAAYRRLNTFLLIACVCPFRQCTHTYRFVCERKYFALASAALTIFHILMTFSCVHRLPTDLTSIAYYRVLKLCQTIGNMYVFGFVAVHLLRSRFAHAAFFDQLFRFDMLFTALIKVPFDYRRINRPFWMETVIFSVYLLLVSAAELTFNKRLAEWREWCFLCCETVQQMGFFIILFHMRNALHNLIVRYRRINQLLVAVNGQASLQIARNQFKCHKNVCQQLELVIHAYDRLERARDRLQRAFASSLLLIYTYNMFAIALSTYIVLSSIFYEVEHHEILHLSQISVQYISNELPLILKELYLTRAFHQFGNMVDEIQGILSKFTIQHNNWPIAHYMDFFSLKILHMATNRFITANNFFPIDFTMLFNMFSAVVTHMVILLQFQQLEERKMSVITKSLEEIASKA